jgi:hypothetical protein
MSIRVTLEIERDRTRVLVELPNALWRWLVSFAAAAFVLFVDHDAH